MCTSVDTLEDTHADRQHRLGHSHIGTCTHSAGCDSVCLLQVTRVEGGTVVHSWTNDFVTYDVVVANDDLIVGAVPRPLAVPCDQPAAHHTAPFGWWSSTSVRQTHATLLCWVRVCGCRRRVLRSADSDLQHGSGTEYLHPREGVSGEHRYQHRPKAHPPEPAVPGVCTLMMSHLHSSVTARTEFCAMESNGA